MASPALLVLDLMDTVIRDPIFVEVPRLLGRSIEEVFRLLDSQAWVAFETGAIDETSYLKRMFRDDPPPGVSSGELRRAILDSYCFLDGMEHLLSDLRRQEVRIWGLSNYSPWMEILRSRLLLDRFFEEIVVSYQTGFRKPDVRAFTSLLARSEIPPDRCLFVDDRLANVEAARQLGMDTLLFHDTQTLRRDLQRLGLLRG